MRWSWQISIRPGLYRHLYIATVLPLSLRRRGETRRYIRPRSIRMSVKAIGLTLDPSDFRPLNFNSALRLHKSSPCPIIRHRLPRVHWPPHMNGALNAVTSVSFPPSIPTILGCPVAPYMQRCKVQKEQKTETNYATLRRGRVFDNMSRTNFFLFFFHDIPFHLYIETEAGA